MIHLYQDYHTDPKADAQRNLAGRTHYVSDDNLRQHHCRITQAFSAYAGLLYAIVTSDARTIQDYTRNSRRGFRYVVFDLWGHVVAHTPLDAAFTTTRRASRALWRDLDLLDAFALTRAGIRREEVTFARDLAELEDRIAEIERGVRAA